MITGFCDYKHQLVQVTAKVWHTADDLQMLQDEDEDRSFAASYLSSSTNSVALQCNIPHI